MKEKLTVKINKQNLFYCKNNKNVTSNIFVDFLYDLLNIYIFNLKKIAFTKKCFKIFVCSATFGKHFQSVAEMFYFNISFIITFLFI